MFGAPLSKKFNYKVSEGRKDPLIWLMNLVLWDSLAKWFGLDWIKINEWYNTVSNKRFKLFNFLKSKKNGYKQSGDKDKK